MSEIHLSRLALSILMSLALAACASQTSTPAPTLPAPVAWTSELASAPANGQKPEDAWWRDFGNPELDELITTALTNNRDLHIAAARLAQARAVSGMAEADRLPEVAMAASAQKGRASSADPKAEVAGAGFRASWEIDLFGAKKLALSAADSDTESATMMLEAARIAVAADVATTYFELVTLQRREHLARESLSVLERQISTAHRRFDAGLITRLDIDRLQSELEQEKANVSRLEGEHRVRRQQLMVLSGNTSLPEGIGNAAPLVLPATLPAGGAPIPADLLERRPDVQRYARALDAATARIGVARRDLYPRLFLNWSGSKEHLSPEGGVASTNLVVGYGLALSLPIFDGGRIRANIAIQEARAQEAMADYEKAMLLALADTETAFAQLQAGMQAVLAMEAAATAATNAQQRSSRLFDAGLLDINTLLDSRRAQLRTSDGLCQAQGTRIAASIAIRRALAGSLPNTAPR